MAKHRKQTNSNTKNFIAVGTGTLAIIAFSSISANASDWSQVAECESSGNWQANTGNGYYGGLQFSDSTWQAYKPYGAPDRADLASKEQQEQAAESVLAAQGIGAWPVCGQYLSYASAPQQTQTWVRPVDGPITSPYGPRDGGFHDGTDFGVPVGTPIRAMTSGTILDAGDSGEGGGGYGNWIRQSADSGEEIQYGHISEWYVSSGQYVNAGEIIGATGNAGSSTGPHLHLRISTGDPMAYLGDVVYVDVPSASVAIDSNGTYTVVSGDTLSGIASAYGMTWQDLWAKNTQIVDPNLIYVGDIINT